MRKHVDVFLVDEPGEVEEAKEEGERGQERERGRGRSKVAVVVVEECKKTWRCD